MVHKKGFTLVELLVVISIIGILATIGLTSFNSTQLKGRDTKRKSDLNQVAAALELYFNDKGKYPQGNSGNMLGCGTGGGGTCTWGESEFSNIISPTARTIYMKQLPTDPSSFSYYYVSPGSTNASYQLYAHLENTKDQKPEVLESILAKEIDCGPELCNYGVSSANTNP